MWNTIKSSDLDEWIRLRGGVMRLRMSVRVTCVTVSVTSVAFCER